VGIEKHRKKAIFKDGATFTGSVGFAGVVSFTGSAAGSVQSLTGAQNIQAPVTIGGKLTVNSVPVFKGNSWTSTSGTNVNAFAGITAVGCGVASVVVSCSVVKSNAIIQVTPILLGSLSAAQASGSIPSQLGVLSITEGGSFTVGWLGGVGQLNTPANAAWQITLQG
jgi:hypothetical protein